MILQEVTSEEYDHIINPQIFFNTVAFNELNRHKVEQVRYFLFRDTKYRFGLCVGMKGKEAMAPFSAPFASFVTVHERWEIKQLDEAVHCFEELANNEEWHSMRVILPPPLYGASFIAAMSNSLLRAGYSVCFQDLNYSLDLKKLNIEDYVTLLPSNGRKNVRIAMKSGLALRHCEGDEEKHRAYGVIAENRKSKGYPLRMTWEDVLATTKIIGHDFFLVEKDGEDIAAAQVFHVLDKIMQVIYWGDMPGYSELKPINFLAYELIQYYGNRGVQYIDVGPSSEAGEPNYGLCDFKASIGCDITAKFTFGKRYRN